MTADTRPVREDELVAVIVDAIDGFIRKRGSDLLGPTDPHVAGASEDLALKVLALSPIRDALAAQARVDAALALADDWAAWGEAWKRKEGDDNTSLSADDLRRALTDPHPTGDPT